MERCQGRPRFYTRPDRYDRCSPGMPGDVEFYVDLAGACRTPVLDLGCGTGRIALPIARAGMSVTGLDIESAMLASARGRTEDGLDLRWVEGDMRNFSLGRRFGLILIAYRGFMHLLTEEDQRSALACARQHLRPGGRLAVDLANPAVLARAIGATERPLFTHRERGLRLRFVFPNEMERLLAEAGLQVEALFGAFDRRPFDDRCSDMIRIARSPQAARSASEFQR